MSPLLLWGHRLSLPMSPYLQALKLRQGSLSRITSASVRKRKRGTPGLDDTLTKGKRYDFGRAGIIAEQRLVYKVEIRA